MVGLCPFHGEKTPSFTVFVNTQSYYCFGCGEAGDVITFVRKKENLGYEEALRMLASRCGVTVPEDNRGGVRRTKIFELNREAAKFFRSTLMKSDEAKAYLINRGLSGKTVARFGLGYCGSGYELYRHLKSLGYSDDEMTAASLIRMKDGNPAPFFRKRIMFPIIDITGSVMGFGGRVIGNGEPKYLNTPDTVAFSKGRNLFALNYAKDHCENGLILCEGYMDVIQMSQGGFLETVAALGTSITPEHVKKLFQLSDHVYFSFDGDAAGFKAARRAMESTLSIISDTQTAHFVLLPQDEDPDSLIKSQGPEAFEAQLRTAFPLSKFFVMDIIREVSQGRGLRTAEERAQAVAIAKPLLQRMTAHALRQLLVQELSAAVRMDPGELAALCSVTLLDVPKTQKPSKQTSSYGRDAKQGERYKRPVRPVTTGPVFTNIKRRLLQCFITHPAWLLKYSEQIEYEMLDTVDEWEEAIVRLWHLAQDHSRGEGFEQQLTTGYLLSFMQGDPLYDRLADLVSEEEVLQTPEEVAEYEIKCAFLKLEKAQLDAQIAELLGMEERGEVVEAQFLERLFKRRQDIHRSLIDESSQAVDFVLNGRLGR